MDAKVSIFCPDRLQVSGLRNATRNTSLASFPFFDGVVHESAFDCRYAVVGRFCGMAEAL